MSWQWIPAQIDAYVGANALDHNTDGLYDFRPGYFVGQNYDEGLYLVYNAVYNERYNRADSVISSTNNWLLVSNPNIGFSVSAFTSADVLVDEFKMYVGRVGQETTIAQNYEDQFLTVYAGKPVYYGDSYSMFYSYSEGGYIIQRNDYRNICTEPVYSTNTLSGGISGEYFWKSSITDFDSGAGVYYDEVSPIPFEVAGAVEQYKKNWGSDYIDHFKVLPYLDYYQYSSPSDISALDEWPAGEYTNVYTGEKKVVGTKCYKGSDNSVWKGHRLGRSGNSGEYWMSDEWGGYSKRMRYFTNDPEFGNCWATVGGSKDPFFVYPNSLSVLPNTFTLQRWEWDADLSTHQHVTSADITLQRGPYQLLSSDNTILMGEFSQWR